MKARSFSRMAIAVAVTVSFAFLGCGNDSVPVTPDAGRLDAGPTDGGSLDASGIDGGGVDAGSLVRLRGGVQKGPFILGSSLTISPIDGVGNPTGTVFNTMTFNDLGEFAIEFSYLGAVSLEATGYYYNEATGALSVAPLTLRAYHEVSSGGAQAAYLNIITHLTYARVRQLVLEGSALLAATDQAEGELRAELGIGPPGFTPEASGIFLNVLGGDSDSNAYLLAVSSVLAQAGFARGGDAALQELLNIVSTDLGTDGRLAAALKVEIGAAYRALDGDAVMAAFGARLATLGSDAVVPDIHRVLDQDVDGLVNASDNCRHVANAVQENRDGDAWGDACDDDTLWPTAIWRSSERDTTLDVAWGDVDGDGDLDLAVGNQGQPNRLYRNDGGTLTLAAVWSSTEADMTYSVAWGDVDGDGDLDLVAGNAGQPNRLYRNDGGTLTGSAAWSSSDSEGTTSVAMGDMDGDGDVDLAAGNFGRPIHVYRNDLGTLTSAPTWSSTEMDQVNGIAWGDVNGDGYPELAVATTAQNRVYANAAGTLGAMAAWNSTESEFTNSVAWGDADGDGDVDLAVGNYAWPNRLYRNDVGVLTAAATWSSTVSDHTSSIAWGDVDEDGHLDLAVGNSIAAEPNRLYGNTSTMPTSAAVWNSTEGGETYSVAWGDMDGDGDLDLAAGTIGGSRVYINILR